LRALQPCKKQTGETQKNNKALETYDPNSFIIDIKLRMKK
jgi:hypothetical protein